MMKRHCGEVLLYRTVLQNGIGTVIVSKLSLVQARRGVSQGVETVETPFLSLALDPKIQPPPENPVQEALCTPFMKPSALQSSASSSV